MSAVTVSKASKGCGDLGLRHRTAIPKVLSLMPGQICSQTETSSSTKNEHFGSVKNMDSTVGSLC